MNTRAFASAALCVAVSLLAGGCASRARVAGSPPASTAPRDALETYIGKVRRLSLKARPARAEPTLAETAFPELRQALDALVAAGTPAARRQAAEAYRRAGIDDKAYDHYTAAVAIDRRDAASYDGLARIWRDWGFPELGLGDAHRAVYYAPLAAESYNTFGTLLYALGRRHDAQRAFERALALDQGAAYAWTNLCYVAFQAGDLDAAAARCHRALVLDPASGAARNNLGLVYAARGDLDAAAAQFSAAGGHAARWYNVAMVLSAGRRYASAATAFEAAQAARPGWTRANERAAQARRLARQAVSATD